jgi:arachidonate 15-lipoxygenase
MEPMIPCLPQNDPQPERRDAELAVSRAAYQFDFGYYDLGFARDVPKADAYSLRYQAAKNEAIARLAANQAAYWVAERTADSEMGWRSLLRKASGTLRERGLEKLWGDPTDAKVNGFYDREPETLATYRRMFQLLDPPELMDEWDDDQVFAWQRLSGCNPYQLERVALKPEDGRALPLLQDIQTRMGLTAAQFALVEQGDTLKEAAIDRRLYVADFRVLHGIEAGTVDCYRHYMRSPLALFVMPQSEDEPWLRPVAIHLTGRGTEGTTKTKRAGYRGKMDRSLFLRPHTDELRKNSDDWSMAKQAVQVADANHQGVVMHLGECHMVAEALILSTRRTLAPRHPLRLLLDAHFQFTLPTNVSTKGLIEAGGVTQTVQSVSLLGAIRLLKRALEGFDWDQRSPPQDFARRGVDLESSKLKEYPARDDGMRVYDAIHEFVAGYVKLYYGLDSDVVHDPEVQAWYAELSSVRGGRLGGINGGQPWATVASLVRFVAQAIYRLTGLHATINYASYDFMAFPPLMPSGGYHPGPDVNLSEEDQDDIVDPHDPRWVMPPANIALQTLQMVYVLQQLKVNRLGHYAGGTFRDPRVPPLVLELQERLDNVEEQIERENCHRLVPYLYLLPSAIPASIHV